MSGLPTDSFLYLGYLPHKAVERKKSIRRVVSAPQTLIFLESPYRILEALDDMLATLGDRRVCVAREMTKVFEEYWRGSLSGAREHFQSQSARGEFTLVVEGQTENGVKWPEQKLLAAIEDGYAAGKSARDLSSELAALSGWSKKDIYGRLNRER